MRRVTRYARAARCVRVRLASYIAWSACSISACMSVPSSGSIAAMLRSSVPADGVAESPI